MKISNVDLTLNANLGGSGAREEYWNRNETTLEQKLSAFPKFINRTSLSRFIVKHEIFKRILPIQGSILECGVHLGGGLMTWANLSALYEPLNHRRRIIGFDTFEGFPRVTPEDTAGGSLHAVDGGYCAGSVEDIEQAIKLFDIDRPLSHIPKVHVVKGDFTKTCLDFLSENQHMIISLLYLDFDIYEPTLFALQNLLDRMPKGAIVAFDELHVAEWPGETQAFVEAVGLRNARIERMPFSSISWWQL